MAKNDVNILQRNFRIRHGEVDIIAMEGAALCFIEVKCWSRDLWPDAARSVNKSKCERLRLTARAWLAEHELEIDYRQIRFDLFLLDASSGEYQWLRGALDYQ